MRRWSYAETATPLRPRMHEWQETVLNSGDRLERWVGEYGSPLHLHSTRPFVENARGLEAVAARRGLDLGIYFARKANKCLGYVEAARGAGLGVDTASKQEVEQTLEAGVEPGRVVLTAAVKPRDLLDLCATRGVTVVLDNPCEVRQFAARVRSLEVDPCPVAVRTSGFEVAGDRLHSRFGIDVDDVVGCVQTLWRDAEICDHLQLEGLHFHLDGYDVEHRIAALTANLGFLEPLRAEGHRIRFIDIGGGLPVCYLHEETQWRAFWQRLRAAQLGEAEPITHRNDGLGWATESDARGASRLVGRPEVYPFWQAHDASSWLGALLDAPMSDGRSIARGVREAGIELRCEPGRALLDGCGLTVARVESVKRHRDGHHYVALGMNRTQCRTSSRDLLLDPVHVAHSTRVRDRGEPVAERPWEAAGSAGSEGYLVGAYCIENELLHWRRLTFESGVAPGDLFAFVNTAGYFMHFLESRSHQFPLALNLLVECAGGEIGDAVVDPIDAR